MGSTSRRVVLFTVVFVGLFAGRADAQTPAPESEATAESTSADSSPVDLMGDDLTNFQLPLAITGALAAFLAVEGRISRQPAKLTDARVTTRRPLRFR